MRIEGRNAVREALQSGTKIDKIIASKTSGDKVFDDIIALARKNGVKIQFVDNNVLNSMSVTKHHQGLIAQADDYKYCSVQDILDLAKGKNEDPFILICDGIEDPHNLGSMIRVCECLGVHGMIIPKNRSCTVNETVVKVSAGATSYVKIAKVTNINDTIRDLKRLGIWVYACELGGQMMTKTKLTGPIAVVVGSEGFGVSQLTKKLCDEIVTIPMYGKVNSLNASVACGMILYEVRRQRNG